MLIQAMFLCTMLHRRTEHERKDKILLYAPVICILRVKPSQHSSSKTSVQNIQFCELFGVR